jgi:hypothetical protein
MGGATTVEVRTNHVAIHVAIVSHPEEVLNVITTAPQAVPVGAEM